MKKLFFLMLVIIAQKNYGMGWWHAWSAQQEQEPYGIRSAVSIPEKKELPSLVVLASKEVIKEMEKRDIAYLLKIYDKVAFLKIDNFLKVRKEFFFHMHMLYWYSKPEYHRNELLIQHFTQAMALAIINNPLYKETIIGRLEKKDIDEIYADK